MSYPQLNMGYQGRPTYQGWPPANHPFMDTGTQTNNGAWPVPGGGHQSYYGPPTDEYDYQTETDIYASPLSNDDHHSYQQTSGAARANGSKKASGIFKSGKKNHMDSVNPTVMVMTANLKRKSNKMDTTNSRQQSSSNNLAAAVSSVKHTSHISTERYGDHLDSISSSPFSHLPVNPYTTTTTHQQFQSSHLEQHPDIYDSAERYTNSTLLTQPPVYENYFHSQLPIQIANKPLTSKLITPKPHYAPVDMSVYTENEYPYHESDSLPSSYQSQMHINSNFPWILKRSSASSLNLGPYKRASIVAVTPITATSNWTLIAKTNNNNK